jgi:1,2-phenylacetyl-CoA epoxidase PaaB subunit
MRRARAVGVGVVERSEAFSVEPGEQEEEEELQSAL